MRRGFDDTPESCENRRREEAARWFVVLQHTELSDRVLKSWKKWEAVPENRAAFDAVEHVWQLAGALPELPNERSDESPVRPRWHSRWQSFGVAAACAMFAAFAIVFLPPLLSGAAPERTVVVETGLGEHKQIVFEDGTRIQLGARTSLTANFSTRARAITLGRGEASFNVARDPKRPFRVSAGGGTITAVGTAFNVQHWQDNDVLVSVSEGTVEVDPAAADTALEKVAAKSGADRFALRISRGQEVTYDAEGQMSPVRPADATNGVDWRNGHFRYTQQPLRHVIEDINRYSHRQLILKEPALGDLLYSGTFFTTGVDEWVIGLQQTYPQIEVSESSESRALIQTRRARDSNTQ